MEEMTADQIQSEGLKALKREFGTVSMIRFMQQFSNEHCNYTEERHEWQDQMTQDQMTVEEIYAGIQAKREKPE